MLELNEKQDVSSNDSTASHPNDLTGN